MDIKKSSTASKGKESIQYTFNAFAMQLRNFLMYTFNFSFYAEAFCSNKKTKTLCYLSVNFQDWTQTVVIFGFWYLE